MDSQVAAALTLGAQGVVDRHALHRDARGAGGAGLSRGDREGARGFHAAHAMLHRQACRVIRTDYALEWEKDPSKIKPFPKQALVSRATA